MQKVSSESILSDLVLQNSSLMPVLFLTGVCGDFNGKTIRQICKEKAINESFLLSLLMAFTDEKFVPTETLPSYGVLQLTALSTSMYPFFLNELDELISAISKNVEKFQQTEKVSFAGMLKSEFSAYRKLVYERSIQHVKVVLPHVSMVYELYYSPDYTSERTDLMNYSLEFYDSRILMLQQSFEEVKRLLEQTLQRNLSDLTLLLKVYAFYQLNRNMVSQDRIEQKLLKPLVLQMEESIILTFHKKNKIFRRSNFVSLPTEIPPPNVLTHREKEVLKLVAQGFMNKEIADQLHIGLTTVITHRKKLVEKLGIKTISGLTVYAYTQGYLDELIQFKED